MKRIYIKILCAITFVALVAVVFVGVIYAQQTIQENSTKYVGTTKGVAGVANVLSFQMGEDSMFVLTGRNPSRLFYSELLFVVLLIAFFTILVSLFKKKI